MQGVRRIQYTKCKMPTFLFIVISVNQPQVSTIMLSVPPPPNIRVMSIDGWIVFQQRTSVDPTFTWQLPWSSYRNGFGTIGVNFWLGLERLHLLTSSSSYRLRIELQQNDTGRWLSGEYSSFRIDNETNKYRLNISGLDSAFSNA